MFKKNYWSLIFLVILFIVPGVAAYVVYQHPALLGNNATNHGMFIKPPVLIKELPDGKKWRLVYYAKNNCGDKCMSDLDKLARIRLALGRHLYEVDGYLFLGNPTKNLTTEQEKILKDIDLHVLDFTANNHEYKQIFDKDSDYFIINPNGYVVLAYGSEASSQDIFQDLKKLVNN